MRSRLLVLITLTLVAGCQGSWRKPSPDAATSLSSDAPFVAYSLREGAERLKTGGGARTARDLGGITSLAGLVHDRASDDLILVGRVRPELRAIHVDDLVVALRSVLTHRELPLVSIEPSAASTETGRLDVVFRGHVADTAYGRDLLDADLALKHLVLGTELAGDVAVESYLDRIAANARTRRSEDLTQGRFWFDIAGSPALAVRDGAVVIRRLRVGVQEEVMFASVDGAAVDDPSTLTDAASASFARDLTDAYYTVSVTHPKIARIKTLLDLVSLSQGVGQLRLEDSPVLSYWLGEHAVTSEDTPDTVARLTERAHVSDEAGREKVVEISGGIRLSAQVIRLRAGSTTAFRDATLGARPNSDALSWRVPLDGWNIPDALRPPGETPAAVLPADADQGTYIETQIRPADSARLRAPAPTAPPVRALPRLAVYERLEPQGSPKVQAGQTAPAGVPPGAAGRTAAAPEYHRQAKSFLASDPTIGNFLGRNPAQRALFGLPLTARLDDEGAGGPDSPHEYAWLRYDFGAELLPHEDPSAPLRPAGASNLLISDRGIGQYDKVPELTVGKVAFNPAKMTYEFRPATFTYDKNYVYPLPSNNPNHPTFNRTYQDVSNDVYEVLKRHYAPQGTALSNPGNFELRTVHDVQLIPPTIGSGSYLTGGQAQARYEWQQQAVIDGVQRFRADYPTISTVHALVSSNGAKATTLAINNAVDRGQNPVDFVTYDDPQVKISDVQQLTNNLGPHAVQIMIPKNSFLPFSDRRGGGELASFAPNAQNFVAQNPEVKLFRYEGHAPGNPLATHIQASANPNRIDRFAAFDATTLKWGTHQEIAPTRIISDQLQTSRPFANPSLTALSPVNRPAQLTRTASLGSNRLGSLGTPTGRFFFASQVPTVDRSLTSTLFPLTSQTWSTYQPLTLQNHVRPGGILLAPELEIVIDKSGPTSALGRAAVASLGKGKTGGTFEYEGKTYRAVRSPTKAKRKRAVRVPAGKFVFHHRDLLLTDADGDGLALDRYYDSTAVSTSPLGRGWSLLPFSLELGTEIIVTLGGTRAARHPVLRDWQTGLALTYRHEVSGYRPITRADQPRLAVLPDGGYVAAFAHDLLVRFNADGRLASIGTSDRATATYHYRDDRNLLAVSGPGGRIDMTYDASGTITGASTADGRQITYVVRAGNVVTVTLADRTTQALRYGGGRLATVTQTKPGKSATTLVDNTYDPQGRMLAQRTPAGRWRFHYDDTTGRATVREPEGKTTEFYYDEEERLIAYGQGRQRMTVLNYDVEGRILQVASARLVNTPKNSAPRFKVSRLITPKQPID